MGMSNKPKHHEKEPEIGWFVAIMTYFSYAIIILVNK